MSRPWCKYYHGMHKQDTCEAGIKFASLQHYGTTQFIKSCPCFGPELGECSQAVYPTVEEMAAHDAEIDARIVNIDKARAAIIDYCGGGKGDAEGVIACPVCGYVDSLHFSRFGYNGHIHARCQTDGCVFWVE